MSVNEKMTPARRATMNRLDRLGLAIGSTARVETSDGSLVRAKITLIDDFGGIWLNSTQYPYMAMHIASVTKVFPDVTPGDPRWITALAKSRALDVAAKDAAAIQIALLVLTAKIASDRDELDRLRQEPSDRRDDDRLRELANELADSQAQAIVMQTTINHLLRFKP